MFTGRADTASPPPDAALLPSAPYPGDHDTTRMLALFDAAASRPLTLAELQDGGVAMPGQALYELQLAGYRIARVYGRDEERRRMLLGYRLDRLGMRGAGADALAAPEPAR
jgi:hypothetical protein